MPAHHEVVVCCVERDAAYAADLVRHISETFSCDVFFYKEITAGTQWMTPLREAIQNAYVVVVLHSKNSVRNFYLEDEAIRARTAGTYLPLVLDTLADHERIPGDLSIQSLYVGREWPLSVGTRAKLKDAVRGFLLRNGPAVFEQIARDSERVVREQIRLRKRAEDELISQGRLALPTSQTNVAASRILELCDAMQTLVAKTLDQLERSEINPTEMDDHADDVVGKLRSIASDAAAAQARSERIAILANIVDVAEEINRLKKAMGSRV